MGAVHSPFCPEPTHRQGPQEACFRQEGLGGEHRPQTGMTAKAARLGWAMQDGLNLVKDRGRSLNLVSAAPVVVAAECKAAAKRWRL